MDCLLRIYRYHTIHHTKREANFCLFMPLFDLLGGTLDDQSWEMQEQTSKGNRSASHEISSVNTS
jgi:sterol desaturase/sphingolipid hydroxylase (fatty acid hydroxylase superfamily)